MRGFPFSCSVEVRYGDIDAMNHVNNAVYVSYLEFARVRMWRECFGFVGGARDIPIILARVVVDYRTPIGLNDAIEIGVGVRHVGRTSFTFAYRIEASGRLAAEAETVQVHYDYAAGKPCPIAEELRRQLAAVRLAKAGVES